LSVTLLPHFPISAIQLHRHITVTGLEFSLFIGRNYAYLISKL
jgi:hypothetical protein